MQNTDPLIWILADDRAGNVNQVLGVAEQMAVPFEIKNIVYNKMADLPNIMRGFSLLGVDIKKSSVLSSPFPDIIIGAGRKTAPIASYIKKITKGKTKIVQIMWPDFPNKQFDMIVLPQHDGIDANERIINTVGSPNRINRHMLDKTKEKWLERFSHLDSPYVALLVGGDTKKGKFTLNHAYELANKINNFFQDKKGSLLITNSRRTNPECAEILKKEIKVKYHYHDFNSGEENPYFGYLAIADVIIASGDSISMCSEACSSGKPVFIFAPDSLTPDKHKNFHQNLYKKGCAKPLEKDWVQWNYQPLDDTKLIAKIIMDKFW